MAGGGVSAPRKWTRDAVLDSLRAAAVGGVAPPARQWSTGGVDHPSRKVVASLFGSFSRACAQAGLEPAAEAASKRRRERQAAKVSGEKLPPKDKPISPRQRERNEQRRVQMAEDVANGRLKVRRLSADELHRYERREATIA